MPLRNVELTEGSDHFIDATIASGRFSDASAAIEEGLRLLEEREHEDEAKLEWLRAAAKDGFDALDRGDAITFSSMDEIAAHIRAIGAEVRAQAVNSKRA